MLDINSGFGDLGHWCLFLFRFIITCDLETPIINMMSSSGKKRQRDRARSIRLAQQRSYDLISRIGFQRKQAGDSASFTPQHFLPSIRPFHCPPPPGLQLLPITPTGLSDGLTHWETAMLDVYHRDIDILSHALLAKGPPRARDEYMFSVRRFDNLREQKADILPTVSMGPCFQHTIDESAHKPADFGGGDRFSQMIAEAMSAAEQVLSEPRIGIESPSQKIDVESALRLHLTASFACKLRRTILLNRCFTLWIVTIRELGLCSTVSKITDWPQPRPLEMSISADSWKLLPSVGTWRSALPTVDLAGRSVACIDQSSSNCDDMGALETDARFPAHMTSGHSCKKLELLMQRAMSDQLSVLKRQYNAGSIRGSCWLNDFRSGTDWSHLRAVCIVQCCWYQCRAVELEAFSTDQGEAGAG